MPVRSSWLVLSLLALCAALAGAWFAGEVQRARAPALASGTWLPQPRSVGALSLVDQSGAPFTEARLRGAPSLLYFGFTNCPDVCPTTLAQLAQVERSAVVAHLRVIFVTVDPARDRPAVLAPYVHAFDSRFIGLTGSPRAIAALAARLGVAYERVNLPGGDYTIDHTAVAFLLDGAGRVVAVFSGPFDAARLAQDLRRAAPYLSS
ncbi:MAG TPA: SCO family protein [Steroidobacteraceae bacterium]|nr:SCO family protein [Steroidobacteraceae bacterium]